MGSYRSYLDTNEAYLKLKEAIDKINLEKTMVDELEGVFEEASGNNIDQIREDLSRIKRELGNYGKKLKTIYENLGSNADKFDKELNTLKARIGQDFVEPVYKRYTKDDVLIVDKICSKIQNVILSDPLSEFSTQWGDGYAEVFVHNYIDREEVNSSNSISTRSRIEMTETLYRYNLNGKFEKWEGNG